MSIPTTMSSIESEQTAPDVPIHASILVSKPVEAIPGTEFGLPSLTENCAPLDYYQGIIRFGDESYASYVANPTESTAASLRKAIQQIEMEFSPSPAIKDLLAQCRLIFCKTGVWLMMLWEDGKATSSVTATADLDHAIKNLEIAIAEEIKETFERLPAELEVELDLQQQGKILRWLSQGYFEKSKNSDQYQNVNLARAIATGVAFVRDVRFDAGDRLKMFWEVLKPYLEHWPWNVDFESVISMYTLFYDISLESLREPVPRYPDEKRVTNLTKNKTPQLSTSFLTGSSIISNSESKHSLHAFIDLVSSEILANLGQMVYEHYKSDPLGTTSERDLALATSLLFQAMYNITNSSPAVKKNNTIRIISLLSDILTIRIEQKGDVYMAMGDISSVVAWVEGILGLPANNAANILALGDYEHRFQLLNQTCTLLYEIAQLQVLQYSWANLNDSQHLRNALKNISQAVYIGRQNRDCIAEMELTYYTYWFSRILVLGYRACKGIDTPMLRERQALRERAEKELEETKAPTNSASGSGYQNVHVPLHKAIALLTIAKLTFVDYRTANSPSGMLDPQCLEAAIQKAQEARAIALECERPSLDPEKSFCIYPNPVLMETTCSIVRFMIARYERTACQKDLGLAIKFCKQALNPTGDDKTYESFRVPSEENRLGILKYNPWVRLLRQLAGCYIQQFLDDGAIDKLQNAITNQENVVQMSVDTPMQQATERVTLAQYLEIQYVRGGKQEILEDGLRNATDAWRLLENCPALERQISCLECLAGLYSKSCARRIGGARAHDAQSRSPPPSTSVEKDQDWLFAKLYADKALRLARVAKVGKHKLSRVLDALSEVHGLSTNPVDLDDAISYASQAVRESPQPDTIQIGELRYNLGLRLIAKYSAMQTADLAERVKVREEAISALEQCFNTKVAPSRQRLLAAVKVSALLIEAQEWTRLDNIASRAVKKMPKLCRRSLSQGDQQDNLASLSGFSSIAAAARLQVGCHQNKLKAESTSTAAAHALALLEYGRDIISGKRLDIRSTAYERLKGVNKQLADEFDNLREQLDPSATTGAAALSDALAKATSDAQMQGGKAKIFTLSTYLDHVNAQFKNVVKRIRALEGFQNFMKPPTAKKLIASLAASQATPGPGSAREIIVVINISFRCDAFIIRNGSLEIYKFHFTDADINAQLTPRLLANLGSKGAPPSDLKNLSRWLWNNLAERLLTYLECTEVLNYKDPDAQWPRIWWVTTGNLCRIPMHLAESLGAKDSVMQRVVSSYSSSIKALVHSRQQASNRPLPARAFLCAVPSPVFNYVDLRVALQTLDNAIPEVENISSLFPVSLTTHKLKGSDASFDNARHIFTRIVEGHSHDSSGLIFHFAGHAMSDPLDPSKSCLFFNDQVITVQNLFHINIKKLYPALGYLSACWTGNTQYLPDEGIHIMGALQLAGFHNVIGSFWPLDDGAGKQVACAVYEKWISRGMDASKLALCLHEAVSKLRNSVGQVSNAYQ